MIPPGYTLQKVVCDDTNNTEDTKAQGLLKVDMYFVPEKPSTSEIDLELVYIELVEQLQKRFGPVDCRTCANRGRLNGLSQESFCESCKHASSVRSQDHYKPKS